MLRDRIILPNAVSSAALNISAAFLMVQSMECLVICRDTIGDVALMVPSIECRVNCDETIAVP